MTLQFWRICQKKQIKNPARDIEQHLPATHYQKDANLPAVLQCAKSSPPPTLPNGQMCMEFSVPSSGKEGRRNLSKKKWTWNVPSSPTGAGGQGRGYGGLNKLNKAYESDPWDDNFLRERERTSKGGDVGIAFNRLDGPWLRDARSGASCSLASAWAPISPTSGAGGESFVASVIVSPSESHSNQNHDCNFSSQPNTFTEYSQQALSLTF